MNYFELNSFLENEILPEINEIVKNYLDDNFSYIENLEDLEDLEYAEVSDDLLNDVKENLYKLISECCFEYDFSKVDDKEINDDLLYQIIDSSFMDYKDVLIEKYNEQFDRQEYFDEYYSGEEY